MPAWGGPRTGTPYCGSVTSSGTAAAGPGSPRGPRRPRRDRRGRGVRGPLAWPAVPAMVSRRQRFDELVLDCAARLETRVGPRFGDVEFAVEDVPPTDPAPWEQEGAPLGRTLPARKGQAARIVVYRRPIEARAHDQRELTALVQEVVVEQVAALLGIPPADLDPRYDDRD
jgi:predicted Zn-dependent protease with MMP-like domain